MHGTAVEQWGSWIIATAPICYLLLVTMNLITAVRASKRIDDLEAEVDRLSVELSRSCTSNQPQSNKKRTRTMWGD